MKKILSVIPVGCLIAFISFISFPSCQKELSDESGVDSSFNATGSLKDTLGVCLPDTAIGTFYNGVVPEGDTAYVQIQVNVTGTGFYNITTEPENGLIFADAGFFNSTGINTIRLKPIGTAILPITTNFSVSFDSSTCGFSVNIQDSTGTGLGGQDTTVTPPDTTGLNTWTFSEDSLTYSGPITLAAFNSPIKLLSITGNTTSSLDSIIALSILFPTGSITPGTYPTSESGNLFSFNSLTTSIIYFADATTSSGGEIVNIVVNTYDSTNKIITGTFSGNALNSTGTSVSITNGEFKASVQ